MRIEDTNAKLEAKLIVLDRIGKVPDVDKAMTELNNAVEAYWEKWEMVRTSNKLILMELDSAMKNIGASGQTGSSSGLSDFIKSNPAPDTRPSFLESFMLEVLTWIE